MIIDAADKLIHINEYYFSTKLKQIAAMKAAGKPVINLGIGNPDLPPANETIQALIDAALKQNTHGYQSYVGIPELRQAMANWYEQVYHIKLDSNTEILPLLGSKEGIGFISHAFLNPNDIALVPNPGYPTYTSATYLAGAIPVAYSLDANNHWLPNLNTIDESTLAKAKIMWLNYPNMPTGADGDIEALHQIIEIAKKYRILICNDNPYSLVLNKEKPFSIFQIEGAKAVAIELNSLSKSHNLAGARVGMLLGDAAYINTVLKVKSNVDSGMYLPMQHAAIAALSSSDTWHIERNKIYELRKNLVWQIMDLLHCTYDKNQVGMFVWAKIPDKYNQVEDLTEYILQEANVFITPGFIFGTNGARYIRISLCSNEEDLLETIHRLKQLTNL